MRVGDGGVRARYTFFYGLHHLKIQSMFSFPYINMKYDSNSVHALNNSHLYSNNISIRTLLE